MFPSLSCPSKGCQIISDRPQWHNEPGPVITPDEPVMDRWGNVIGYISSRRRGGEPGPVVPPNAPSAPSMEDKMNTCRTKCQNDPYCSGWTYNTTDDQCELSGRGGNWMRRSELPTSDVAQRQSVAQTMNSQPSSGAQFWVADQTSASAATSRQPNWNNARTWQTEPAPANNWNRDPRNLSFN